MLTLKLISEETERVIKGLEKKHFAGAREAIEKVLEYDKLRRESQQKLDSNKQHQNQLSKQIGGLMKEGKRTRPRRSKQRWLSSRLPTRHCRRSWTRLRPT